MSIATQPETHAGQELQHAITISKQIDYLGGMPITVSQPVQTSENAEEMLRMDLDNEEAAIRNYRERIHQCEVLEEFALTEQIRDILVERNKGYLIDLATAPGEDVPKIERTKDHEGVNKPQGLHSPAILRLQPFHPDIFRKLSDHDSACCEWRCERRLR